MEQVSDGMDRLARLRDALFDACRKAGVLADRVERMESVYAGQEGPLDPSCFYIPSTGQTGRELDEPLQEDHLRLDERRVRKAAIDAALALRAAVDRAIGIVGSVADLMNGPNESVDRRWTIRTIDQLRLLRGVILNGHGADFFPSALPMVRVGVPDDLRNASESIWKHLEEVKSAIFAGIGNKPHTPTASLIGPQERLQAGTAESSGLDGDSGDTAPTVNAPSTDGCGDVEEGLASPPREEDKIVEEGPADSPPSESQDTGDGDVAEAVNARGEVADTRSKNLHYKNSPPRYPQDDGNTEPALTENQSLVLHTMARFDGSRLLSAASICVEMNQWERLSERTVHPIVRKLIRLHLAERPEGSRSGARLTIAGRKLASKIAD